jgi:hypothetical protein
MNLETAIFSQAPQAWRTRQAIIFDWYDGPRAGVVSLEYPDCEFHCQFLSEQPNADDLDDRLFRISELPRGSVANILSATRVLGEPTNNVWVPVWQFPSDRDRAAVEAEIERLLTNRRETDIVIWTRDMKEFLGCWHAERNGIPASSWFTKLGIPN